MLALVIANPSPIYFKISDMTNGQGVEAPPLLTHIRECGKVHDAGDPSIRHYYNYWDVVTHTFEIAENLPRKRRNVSNLIKFSALYEKEEKNESCWTRPTTYNYTTSALRPQTQRGFCNIQWIFSRIFMLFFSIFLTLFLLLLGSFRCRFSNAANKLHSSLARVQLLSGKQIWIISSWPFVSFLNDPIYSFCPLRCLATPHLHARRFGSSPRVL